jgi:uncharacterized protein involved in copper resistance
LSGPAHAADQLFGAQAMAEAREGIRREHGDMTLGKLLIDRIEAKVRDGRDGYAWDAQGWYGGDIDKLWVKTEGEGAFGQAVEQAEVQALWSHAIGPFFDLQAGARYDIRRGPTAATGGRRPGPRPLLVRSGRRGLVSTKGDLSARVEAEYDQRITQKLILQPRIEFDLTAQDVPDLGIGSGLSTAELGLRLRYELKPQFAPYIGVDMSARSATPPTSAAQPARMSAAGASSSACARGSDPGSCCCGWPWPRRRSGAQGSRQEGCRRARRCGARARPSPYVPGRARGGEGRHRPHRDGGGEALARSAARLDRPHSLRSPWHFPLALSRSLGGAAAGSPAGRHA